MAQVQQYRVLVAPPRRDLVALAELASMVADVPMATINLITETEQHSIATAGFDRMICARDDSMCGAVFDGGELVVVPDARKDPRWQHNPFVTGVLGRVRFYASHPLVTPEGIAIGTLCVFDNEVRTMSARQQKALVDLAERVVDVLELGLRTRTLASTVEDLQHTQQELARSNEALTAFAGQISHDLRNPLAAVQMALAMLGEFEEAPAEATFLLDRAASGVRRMQALIDDLLDYARVGAELARVPVDLSVVVAETLEDLAVALDDARVSVGPLPTVFGDPVQLRAILQNLIANAAKFTRPGQPPHIDINALRLDDHWRVDVTDRGPGVPEEHRLRVFDPLARVDESVEGSGIGLATCRRIVESHGGTIGLDPADGGGTRAWFTLPG
jgi:signal transduction histidine kinase